ncbi:hypothetical protein [Methylobacterium nodulans]|uniref:Uncharacterized protein n=1 Tax=Methylobacterium nodulans (strain LMG 21967 / CNCM I-2342 / ORS 2060) TaxID=460265 RepID=B8II50_METNO|nr:hypothetical protein [Methylobacterium nodulans]ACL57919.1 hypothetical protein Mnod_2969 [Methylobacterium nodulans ORS 2060]
MSRRNPRRAYDEHGAARVLALEARLEPRRGTAALMVAVLGLPIGASTIKRIRRLLGHHYIADHAAWWEARAEDLADLTIEAFAARHGCSVGGASQARAALFGPSLRPAGWWRAPDVAAVILADRPRADIADDLGISVGTVGRLRWMLQQDRRR